MNRYVVEMEMDPQTRRWRGTGVCPLSGEDVVTGVESHPSYSVARARAVAACEQWVKEQEGLSVKPARRVPMTEAEATAMEDTALERFKWMALGHR
jgi:hypothetical protein